MWGLPGGSCSLHLSCGGARCSRGGFQWSVLVSRVIIRECYVDPYDSLREELKITSGYFSNLSYIRDSKKRVINLPVCFAVGRKIG